MREYYKDLPNLRVNFIPEQVLVKDSRYPSLPESISTVYENCEYDISANFCIIYQDTTKTIIPLVQIKTIEYPIIPKEPLDNN